ncbi:MAG: DNA primase DnaG [Nanoarchaeota archaeon]|nr:DNA primase DnaG [Nanoarchaeota archaeon]
MGKISLVSAKYIIHATINVDGTVDRPDIIGSVFGQTEGLLGSDLELRELQSSGRIGRIEVDVSTKEGKTSGTIMIPCSVDKTETALIAAAIETIQRIGPCNATVKVTSLEDIRAAKRSHVIDRAKALLSNLTHGTLPDSKDIKDKVSSGVKIADIVTYGIDKLPAGPHGKDAESVILVEGRADVINLLRYDIKNAIAMNGTSIPKTIIDLSKKKEVTVFVDGDRGGDLIIKELSQVADIDYVAYAPDGKEVEEITHKEIHQALRSRIKMKDVISKTPSRGKPNREYKTESRDFRSRDRRDFKPRDFKPRDSRDGRPERRPYRDSQRSFDRTPRIPKAQREKFIKFLDELSGTKEAYLIDAKINILGKVPAKEIISTLDDFGRLATAVIIDGSLTKEILEAAETGRIRYLIGTKSTLKDVRSRVNILLKKDLE